MLYKELAMQKLKNIILFIVGFAIGGGGLLVLTLWGNSWHRRVEYEIEEAINTNDLHHYVISNYNMSLRPDADQITTTMWGEKWSYKLQYEYIAEKTNYECTQLAPYNPTIPTNEVAECHKK